MVILNFQISQGCVAM